MKFSKYLPYLGLIALILFLITDTSTFINDIPLNTKKNFKQSEGSHKEGSHKEGSNGQDISQKDKEKKKKEVKSFTKEVYSNLKKQIRKFWKTKNSIYLNI